MDSMQSVAAAKRESGMLQFEAREAQLRKEVATAEAAMKTAEARFQTELDFGRAEVRGAAEPTCSSISVRFLYYWCRLVP